MFPILLIRRVNTFWSEGIDTFCSGGIGTVWTRKIGNNHKSFELYQSVIYNFLYPTVPKFPFYILCAYYPNYLLLENPNFVSLPTPNSLVFDLAYTTCINLNLWSNDKFRLKCADTSNFL